MKRPIAILLGVVLLMSADAVFARGGRGSGGHHGGGMSMGFHGGHAGITAVSAHIGHPVGRPFVGVRPGPVFVGRPRFPHRHRVFVGGTIVVGAPFFYPYPYYPPVYAVPPSHVEPPAYVEQGGGVYYYCPDYNDYYPNVPSCPSQWVPVSAAASEAPR